MKHDVSIKNEESVQKKNAPYSPWSFYSNTSRYLSGNEVERCEYLYFEFCGGGQHNLKLRSLLLKSLYRGYVDEDDETGELVNHFS